MMTHRDRVLTAVDHKEPDRIPMDMGSVGSLLVDSVYFDVKKQLGITEDIPPYRMGSTANYYDERIMEALDTDFRHVWLSSPDKPKNVQNPDGTVTDEWGITWSKEGSWPDIFPLKDLNEQEISNFAWPGLSKGWNVDALRERARHFYQETDYAVVAKSVLDGAGIFERCYYMRSLEQFFTDMMENEDLVRYLVQRVMEVEISRWDIYLSAVGEYVQIIQRATDLGTQSGLLISPAMYRKFIKPADQKVYEFIKKKAPHAKIWFHSCGAIEPLIGDFLDIGVEILNPVQPNCTGMDSYELKRKYGSKLTFHGGIDIQKALPGSKEDVIREVETRIKAFAPGGGYILAPANHIQKDTPGENVLTMYRHAAEYGKYPLGR